MAFTHTDLPLPVEPAISRCGIRVRSVVTTLPAMSIPRAIVRGLFDERNCWLSKIVLILTELPFLFGTSIPTAALFGIGASIRTPLAARLRAISSARFVILLIFTPARGCSS